MTDSVFILCSNHFSISFALNTVKYFLNFSFGHPVEKYRFVKSKKISLRITPSWNTIIESYSFFSFNKNISTFLTTTNNSIYKTFCRHFFDTYQIRLHMYHRHLLLEYYSKIPGIHFHHQ